MSLKSKIKEKYYKIFPDGFMDWWYSTLVHDLYWKYTSSIRSFFRNLKRVRVYLPVIWKDHDWDCEGIWDLLEIKLLLIKKQLVHGTLAKNQINDIDMTLIVIDKLKNHDYERLLHNTDFIRSSPQAYNAEKDRVYKEREEDEKFIFNIIQKNYKSWWD